MLHRDKTINKYIAILQFSTICLPRKMWQHVSIQADALSKVPRNRRMPLGAECSAIHGNVHVLRVGSLQGYEVPPFFASFLWRIQLLQSRPGNSGLHTSRDPKTIQRHPTELTRRIESSTCLVRTADFGPCKML